MVPSFLEDNWSTSLACGRPMEKLGLKLTVAELREAVHGLGLDSQDLLKPALVSLLIKTLADVDRMAGELSRLSENQRARLDGAKIAQFGPGSYRSEQGAGRGDPLFKQM